MFQKIGYLGLLCCLLFAGCSARPDEKVSKFLSEGKYDKAVEWVADLLKDEPENVYLNYLLSSTYIQKCIAQSCFEKSPEDLAPLEKLLPKVTRLDAAYKDVSINVYTDFEALLTTLQNSKDHPVALVALLKVMPKSLLQTQAIDFMAKAGLKHVQEGAIPETISLFSAIATQLPEDNPNRYLSKIIYGYASNDMDVITQAQASVGRIDESLNARLTYVQALPYALYQYAIESDPNDGTRLFMQDFRTYIQKMNFAYFATPEGRAELGNAVYAISRDKPFLLKAQKHFLDKVVSERAPVEKVSDGEAVKDSQAISVTDVPQVDSAMIEEEPLLTQTKIPDAIDATASPLNEELRLRFMKLALLVNPSSEKSWKVFLDQATDYAMRTGRSSVLFDYLKPQDVPAVIIAWYNASLFKLMRHNIQENKSILGLVQHITLPATGADAVKTQVSSLLNEAMIKAVDDENYDLVYEYASFQPDVAKLSRQKIVSITIDALEKKWEESEFTGMDILAQFLTRTMGIDFSLDSFLLQSFDEQLAKNGIQERLGASTPENLLQERDAVRVDLLDKFDYLRMHFKDQPDVLDNLLKSLIVKAEGAYGVANALYLLYDHFSDNFSEAERNTYLVGAIKKSLSEDQSMSAENLAQTGTSLHKRFPDISMLFIVNEALSRAEGLNEIRMLWEKSPEEFVQAIREIKPQYVTLMSALNAYENGDHQKAAALFTILSDPKLIKIARPYLTEYVATVKEHAGVYVTYLAGADSDMHTQIIRIELSHPVDEVRDEGQVSTPETDFLGANITFISQLGQLKESSASDFSEDSGRVVVFNGKGQINPNTMSVVIPDAIKHIDGIAVSFEKVFGDVTAIQLLGDSLIFETTSKNYTFEKIAQDPATIFPPQGRYSLTTPLSDLSGSKTYMMPVGSILELYTDLDESEESVRSDKENRFRVSGLLYHPAAEDPVKVKGVYDSVESVVSLVYDYPFPGGGTLSAQARCQLAGVHIICAGHNKHWKRHKYNYQISGTQIQPEEGFEEPGVVLSPDLSTAEGYQSTGVKNR